jgi:shikimate dehydrogenase
MHMAGYRALGLNYFYVPFQLELAQLPGAMVGMRALGIRGFGVSMPFKLQVMEHLDALDPLAERIGAVNTVVNDAGHLTGYNTDAWGACAALGEVRELKGARVLLLGAGGAARAVAFGLVNAGASVAIANRTQHKGEELAARVAAHGEANFVGSLDALGPLDAYDVLVNTSSMGMVAQQPGSPVPAQALRPELLVMDIVYKPMRTALIEQAQRAGARTIQGGRMLLHQASRQFELYTGRPAPLEAMDHALREQLSD